MRDHQVDEENHRHHQRGVQSVKRHVEARLKHLEVIPHRELVGQVEEERDEEAELDQLLDRSDVCVRYLAQLVAECADVVERREEEGGLYSCLVLLESFDLLRLKLRTEVLRHISRIHN